MGTVANLVVKVSASTTDFEKQIAGIQKQWARTGAQLQSIGADLTKAITLPLAGIAIGTTKMAMDFDSAMTKVRTLASESAANVNVLRQKVLELAPTVGIGPTKLAEALLMIESNGLRGQQAMEVLTMSAKASAIGMGSTTDIAKALTAAVNAYGAENLSAARAADILTATVDAGGAEATELAGEIGRVVGVASQLGVSFDQVGAFIATYTRLGLSAAEATTGLSGVLNMILNPSAEARKALAGIGMSAETLRQSVKEKGLNEALINLLSRVKGNGDAVGALFGNVRALAGVMGTAGTQAETYRQILEGIQKSTGTLNERFEIWRHTTAATWSEFTAQIQVVAIHVGETLAPAFSKVLQAAMPLLSVLEFLVKWFADLPGPVQTTAIGLAAVAAAAGPVTYAFGAFMETGSGVLRLLKMLPGATTALASATQYLGGSIMGILGPVGAYIAAMSLINQGVKTQGFQNWAATSDSYVAGALRWSSGMLTRGKGFERLTQDQVDAARASGVNPAEAMAPMGPFPGPAMPAMPKMASPASDEITRRLNALNGTDAAKKANEWVSDLKAIGGLSKLSADQAKDVHKAMVEAIDSADRFGKVAPKAWKDVAAATMPVVDETSKAVYNFKEIGGMSDEFKKLSEAIAPIQTVPFFEQLPSAEESTRNLATLTDSLSSAMQQAASVKPPSWWSQFTDVHGLQTLANAFHDLANAFGGAAGSVMAGIGGIVGAYGAFKQNGAPVAMVDKIGAIAAGAGAVWASTQAGGAKGKNALSGAASGAMAGMAFGPWGAAIGAGVGALTGFFRSRSVSKDEKDARALHHDFESQILATLNAAQVGEAAGRRWAGALIGVRDAFAEIGLSGLDAQAAMDRLNDATRIGSEAVRAEIEKINVALERAARLHDALAQQKDEKRRVLQEAVEKYGISFDAAGKGFQSQNLAGRAEQLLNYHNALTESGMAGSAINTAMASDFSMLANDALRAGIDLPTEMRDIFAQLIDARLLTSDKGGAFTNLDVFHFSDELKPLFESVLMKLDELITELRTPIAALQTQTGVVTQGPFGTTLVDGQLVPQMAKGGIVRRPTFAMIGEAGPEAVVPLDEAGPAIGGTHVHFHGTFIDRMSLTRFMESGEFADVFLKVTRRDRNGLRSGLTTLTAGA